MFYIYIFVPELQNFYIKLHHNQYPPSDIGLFLGSHRAITFGTFLPFLRAAYNILQYITVYYSTRNLDNNASPPGVISYSAGRKKTPQKKDDPCITKIEQVKFSSVTSKSCHLLHAFRLMIIIIFKNCIDVGHFWPKEL